MPTSFVLINTEIGFETDVLKELKKVEGVDEASAVYTESTTSSPE